MAVQQPRRESGVAAVSEQPVKVPVHDSLVRAIREHERETLNAVKRSQKRKGVTPMKAKLVVLATVAATAALTFGGGSGLNAFAHALGGSGLN